MNSWSGRKKTIRWQFRADEILFDGYATRRGLARVFGVHEWTLHRWELEGKGPKPMRVRNLILYSVADAQRWLESLDKKSSRLVRSARSQAHA